MTFAVEISDLATRVKEDIRLIHEAINGVATAAGYDSTTLPLTSLTTTDQSSLIAAINELDADIAALPAPSTIINDAASSTTTTYSSDKITADIAAAVAALVDSSPAALDTLNELATALGNDPAFATTITNALALKANSADVYTQAQLGDPTTDYVAVYDAA